MELINWSLNAIDRIFSTRKSAAGEATCPEGTFPSGYLADSWGKWQPLCLAILQIEDVEDVFLFVLTLVGQLLLALLGVIFYRKFRKFVAAQERQGLPDKIETVGTAVGTQSMVVVDMKNNLDGACKGIKELKDNYGWR